MDKEYKPDTIAIKLVLIGFSLIALLTFFMDGFGGVIFVGLLTLLVVLVQSVNYNIKYEAFVLTEHSLIIKNWRGKIKNETKYNQIGQIYFKAGIVRQGRILPIDVDVESISLWMKEGGTIHLNVTPIEDSHDFYASLKVLVDQA